MHHRVDVTAKNVLLVACMLRIIQPDMGMCSGQYLTFCLRVVQTDPTCFLSGSDDNTVRLWSLRDEGSVATIDAHANVCSVQFSPVNSNLIAFGSANYKSFLYDMRQVSYWVLPSSAFKCFQTPFPPVSPANNCLQLCQSIHLCNAPDE